VLSNLILIFSNDSSLSNQLKRAARKSHFYVKIIDSAEDLFKIVKKKNFLSIFIDYKAINNSLDFTPDKLLSISSESLIHIVISTHKIEEAITTFRGKPFDLLKKPLNPLETERAMLRLRWIKNLFNKTTRGLLNGNSIESVPYKDGRRIDNVALEELVELKLKQIIKKLNLDTLKGLYKIFLEQVEKPLFKTIMDNTGFNQIKTAKILGINRNTLRKKIKEYGIKV